MLVLCVVISFILDVRLVDAPDGGAQEEAHTDYFYLPSAGLAIVFLARRIQPPLSLVDREVEFCVLTKYLFSYYIYIYILSFLWNILFEVKEKTENRPSNLDLGCSTRRP